MEGICMRRKTARVEFVNGLLERLGTDNGSSFHASAFTHAFEGIRARFRELK